MASAATPASTGISSPSDSLIITSPVLSASSLSSSFDFVAVQQQSNSEHRATGAFVVPAAPNNTVVLTGEDSSFSDDEIVWSVSESEDFEGIHGGAVLSDDDFVVLDRAPRQSISRPRPVAKVAAVSASKTGTATGSVGVVAAELAKELARLNIDAESVEESDGTKMLVEGGPSAAGNAKKKVKKPKKERTEEEERLRQQRKKERKEKKKQEKAAEKALKKEKALAKELRELEKEAKAAEKGTTQAKKKSKQVANDVAAAPAAAAAALTSPISVTITGNDGKNSGLSAQHNVVISEKVSEQTTSQDTPSTAYDEAVDYITSYISNPTVRHDRVCHLTLLQSFIVELGLLTDLTLLPRSIRSAKTFVKSRAFLNIKDYLSKRHEGQHKIKELMFPSRSALVRDMRRNKNHASLKWVKKQGLQDLLVSAFHRS
ncbi:hypothetical protein P691DRAFT_661408 [Macrolepiota fuliginosa MF-IS2]|uniref:Uncharacterized protein n=1 Tax=Macrolepiota fuliginosa MF-IS2 TaxID=1400762 RepID=A0A9P5XIV0_9AGAR|nr:hypothetical protein P691DRAFT_661408 [Macrolepiota fuliginosa MF-IS2]